ncbi:putative AAA+ ATPase domain, pigment precursor permease/Protein ATP-binding cassette sub-family G [Helianthus annuus]|uniref:AAA+ ATPase domain, pigment permease/Protein ATP-binding cassette sub-family G n=1 Tax=Helianthus annuus TaxID=4232 RepID=A0A9K3N033_HELAN|nr:putative AAA+ ATPase domain, pigment precursor permease/Protein ATP-binding cassette sub-family G [Helianthus annuus]KAJ0501560.1 putative ABC transporter, AAA+ ATPase domain, ABC-2 type transporter [Helianthus annuus]KAJ0509376.1 putative ABC transporter, AAA+ ATPase domain, ABC-2 type transporter [Helianthus annuus]KAJ0517467.1 putative ABC transporter, AAA+ ATPase domain, ABC-2 type transporter [Helianthus annuus]KAJ0685477.1 putative ABC transporter, AAA+ ATPase domain, ABC-2 type transp
MAQLLGSNEIEFFRTELRRSLRSLLRQASNPRANSDLTSVNNHDETDENLLMWAAIERLPTYSRLRSSLFDEENGKKVVDVTKLLPPERQLFIEKLIKHIEHDNLRLLQKLRRRTTKVGVKFPSVEVRYENIRVVAECEVVHGKPLPTIWNSLKSMLFGIAMIPGLKSKRAKITILNDISGVIKPGRMTVLLGPPGCGKTSLLKALSGNLDKSLKISGEISYNGYKLEEFVPQKTSAYISQDDLHIPEMTVRETLDFSSRCQGTGSRSEIMHEVNKREKELGIIPDPDLDTFMKAISVEGQKTTLQTNYILKVILGLDICADTMFGDAMRRGISGGQKKRLTTGEMIVGPAKALFMDEISNGLDSSTTYQIVTCLQQLAHITDASILISLLQPSPEAFDLFDDIMLMAEGMIVYHGPRSNVLEYFEGLGFKCPERKGVADFLQEVCSKKDQEKYWCRTDQAYNYVSVHTLNIIFKESYLGKEVNEDISTPLTRLQSHEGAMSFNKYSLSKWDLFRVCMSREILLMKRNSFAYIFKFVQVLIIAVITMTVFFRTKLKVDAIDANYYLGSLFYSLVILLVDGFPELSMTVARLPVFYKQRDMYFHPAWAYAIPASLLKVPLSMFVAIIWTCLTYYVIGYSPEPERFFRQLVLNFAMHFTSESMFQFFASVFRTVVASTTSGSMALLFLLSFGGFILPYNKMPTWLKWGFWVCPLSYGEIGLTVNEFLSPRWNKIMPTNTTMGLQILQSRGLDFDGYYFWISLGALFGFALLFNIGFVMALSYLKAPGTRAIISKEVLSQEHGNEVSKHKTHKDKTTTKYVTSVSEPINEGKLVLPFEPLTLTFQNLQYHVEPPPEMREHGFTGKRLQLLHDITGAFRPGVLTALMGVSGAGKTTLLDVLSGRKTSGIVEGEIKIGGYPKVQDTFARVSGYCEQTDVHSPQITVLESITFSAWLRLHPGIDSKTKYRFIEEILETVELDSIKDALVGIPGVNGLSTEQRKRLTIAVEVVANPSIIFMDEPTTGLDARSAAIVMRAVKNIVETGRTIVCTIHQPSIDIFEAFDELILLKNGGRMIYCGPLGCNSNRIIEYFEGISGVPKIRDNYNPATWMLEVTSSSMEAELEVDFAQIYSTSTLNQSNKDLVNTLSKPPPGSKDLYFPTRFPQNSWSQFKACLWKQRLSYWRSPSYNLMRSLHILFASFMFGLLFWGQGRNINSTQNIFNILGFMYSAVLFSGINNCSSVIPHVSMERTVLYRERFSGMYASWAYTLAQVAIEFPYLSAQSLAFVCITYPMIGFHWSAYKVFWYFYAFLCTLMYFTYLGMLLVAITPSFPVAAILQSAFYTIFNLLSGFLIPKPKIPKWWLWLYYLTPTSWSLNAMLTSQFGDVKMKIVAFGEIKSVEDFLKDYFGYRHEQLPLVFILLALWPIVLAILFAYCIAKLNFQRR